MRKRLSLFDLYKIRLMKFMRRHYKTILNASYFVVLLSLFGWTSYFFFYAIAFQKSFRFTAETIIVSIFCGLGFLNFLLAYSFAMIKEKQVRDLTHLVMVDELTEVFNKRFFLRKLHSEIVRSRRYSHIVSLLVLDIDHFKRLNDTYGHMCGDVILRNIAKIIQGEIRMVDVLCRFGGEEFVVICPETSIHEAKAIAERIRKRIAATEFRVRSKNITITISIGANQFDPIRPKSETSLFQGADEALYVAKNHGRNRVVLYSSALHSTVSLQKKKKSARKPKAKVASPQKHTQKELM